MNTLDECIEAWRNGHIGRGRVGKDGWSKENALLTICLRCLTKWDAVRPHMTFFSLQSMCPLCEECWQELSIAERLPFYYVLCETWRYYGGEDISKRVETAVKRGG